MNNTQYNYKFRAFTPIQGIVSAGIAGLIAFIAVSFSFYLIVDLWTKLNLGSVLRIVSLWIFTGYLLVAAGKYLYLSGYILRTLQSKADPANNNLLKLIFNGMVWPNGLLKNEAGFRFLQKHKSRIVEQIQFQEQFLNMLVGMLALLPGVKNLLEQRAIQDFHQQPRPLRIIPRIQSYVWGQLAEESAILKFLRLKTLPGQKAIPIAELWLGDHQKNPSQVRISNLNIRLDKFFQQTGSLVLGPNQNSMNQLFKMLAAIKPLSFQIHEQEKLNGKNECWMVWIDYDHLKSLSTDKVIAELYLGLRPINEMGPELMKQFSSALDAMPNQEARKQYLQVEFRKILEQEQSDPAGKTIKALCNKIVVKWEQSAVEIYCNDKKLSSSEKSRLGIDKNLLVVNIPGGTIHSLSQGLIFELQEKSDKTLRLYDHGRSSEQRPLNIEEGIDKLDCTFRSSQDYMVSQQALDNVTLNTICTPLYAMDLIDLSGQLELPQTYIFKTNGKYKILVVLQGKGSLIYPSFRDCVTIQKTRLPRSLRSLAMTFFKGFSIIARSDSDEAISKTGVMTQSFKAENTAKLGLKQGDTIIIPASLVEIELQTQGGLKVLKAYEPTQEEQEKIQQARGDKYFWEKS